MFYPHKSDNGAAQPWEYLPAAAGSYQPGQLLQLTDGKLCMLLEASKETPPYLCQAKITVEDGENVPVTRVSDDVIYETQMNADTAAADVAVGTMLQVSAGGLKVDADDEGSFEITSIEGTAADSIVRGRFQSLFMHNNLQ